MRRLVFIIVFVAVTLSLSAMPVMAQGVAIDPMLRPDYLPTASGNKSSDEKDAIKQFNADSARLYLMERIVKLLLAVAGAVSVYFIVNSGFWLAASAGREDKISEHKKALTWILVGLLLMILSFSIVQFIIKLTLVSDQTPAPQADVSAPAAPPR